MNDVRYRLTSVALSLALFLAHGTVVSSHLEDLSEILAALHTLVEQEVISEAMHSRIDRMYERGATRQLASYLERLAKSGEITASTSTYIQTLLGAGVPTAGEGVSSPVLATYAGNGNVTKLGQLNPYAPFLYYGEDSANGQTYQDLAGYSAAGREYALLAHSQGLVIIDVTDPANPVALQFIPGLGGRVNHDVDTYEDPISGKTFAYFGGQANENLFSIDLSYLPGTIPGSGILNLGRTNYAHTLQVTDGLLFANSAGSSLGCRVFDVQANPVNPPLLTQGWSGPTRDCHDSFTRDNVLYSADGYSSRWRIVDINGIRSGIAPTLIGETAAKPGRYAHSGWLSDDSQYLFAFEEFNVDDINVFDVSTPSSPVNVKTFQWSGDAATNSKVHNGRVKGNLLYVAYYEAGFRVFDIADPLDPIEVGKYETWRDPDGDGTFNKPVSGEYNGAWHVYTELPSGNILVSDMRSGLFIFNVVPLAPPAPPEALEAVAGDTEIRLSWSASGGATSYTVKRADAPGGPYAPVIAGVTATNFIDFGLTNGTSYYYVVSGVNEAGESLNSNEASAIPGVTVVLAVASQGAGSGVVSSSPPGISCPGTCEEAFLQGTSVTLSATPLAGSTFMGWGGACTGTVPCVVTMDAAKSATATFTPTGRDLVETSVSNPPGLVAPATAFNVSDTARNRGSLTAGSSLTRYYLSLDAIKTSADPQLSGSRSVPALTSGTESSGVVSVRVPESIAVGTYRLFACADATKLVAEVDEANNCAAAATTVTVVLSDLIETAVSAPPPVAAPGATFSVTDTVQNISTVTAPTSSTRHYLSADTVKDPGDVVLNGTRPVSSLPAGMSSTGSKTVTIPSTTPLGTYHVLSCADALANVRETNETNNCLASDAALTVAWPDLVVSGVSNPPADALPGTKFALTDTVMNQGAANAGSSTVRYYLSPDAATDGEDVLLVGTRSVPGLGSGASSTGTRTVTVPTTMPPGTYLVLACADDLNRVGEGDDANNCRASATPVAIH